MSIDADIASDIAVLKERTRTLEDGMAKLEELIEKVHDRIPNWAVWAFTIGGGIIGSLLTWLISCLK